LDFNKNKNEKTNEDLGIFSKWRFTIIENKKINE